MGYYSALLFLYARDYDRAFQYFDRAVADRNGFLGALVVDSVYDPIRTDPRFAALLDRVGLLVDVRR